MQVTPDMIRTVFFDNEVRTEKHFDALAALCHQWFSHIQGFDDMNVPKDLMLVVTELGEACEADRKPGPSGHIPEFTGLEEELADALVRILHMAGKYDLRIGAAFVEKMRYNFSRPVRHGKEY